MLAKFERRSNTSDFVDDLVEMPSNALSPYKFNSLKLPTKQNYSSLPSLATNYQFEKNDNLMKVLTSQLRERLHLTKSYSNPTSKSFTNNERRKEIDHIIRQLYDGNVLTTTHDDHPMSDESEQSINLYQKQSSILTGDDDDKPSIVQDIDLLSVDGDVTSLQRELQEKELDIVHLHKEIQDLQIENKRLHSKISSVYPISSNNNNRDIDILQNDKETLLNEIRISQELVSKYQHQQHQNRVISRSNQINEIALHQNEALEHKLKSYEKRMRILNNENNKLKKHVEQIDETMIQLRRDNDDLKKQIHQLKKHNDDLFYQELHSFRNDLKVLKQRNNELFEENIRLQKQLRTTSPLRTMNYNSKNIKTTLARNDSSNMSEESDSTSYLTTVEVEKFNSRSFVPINRSSTFNENHSNYQTTKYNALTRNDSSIRNNNYSIRSSKLRNENDWNDENTDINDENGVPKLDLKECENESEIIDDAKALPSNFYTINDSLQRSRTLNDSNHYSKRLLDNDKRNPLDEFYHKRRSIELTMSKRPYAPLSTNDIHLNDIVKFSRPGGKIGKGIVKYIGKLPDKNEEYVGLELEDEETKHDGVYQNQRFFQCKSNRGIFVDFNRVIMAWSDN